MSCNLLQAMVGDAGTEGQEALPNLELIDVATLDFHGWQYVQVPMPAGTNRVMGFRLVPTDSRMGQSGTLLIDDVLYKHGQPNSGVDAIALPDVNVGPVPASDYIVASAGSLIHGVELLDLAGKVVTRAVGNCINVADIPAGHYLLRVHLGGLISTHKVIIIHN